MKYILILLLLTSCATYKPPKQCKQCGMNYELRNDTCWQVQPKASKIY